MKPNRQPCVICKNHKPNAPFKLRDDEGNVFKVTHICNCPFCGRFLEENYKYIESTAEQKGEEKC